MLLLTLLVAAIMLVQLYYLGRVYNYEQKEFNSNVIKSIRGIFEDMDLMNGKSVLIHRQVEHPDASTFLVRIDTIPSKDSLIYYLSAEFEDFDVMTDCKVAVFDSDKDKYLFEVYLPTAASNHPQDNPIDLKHYDKEHHFININFPHREQYIIHQLDFWIVTTVLLLIALIGFAASLFYFYRQKFLNEVQKDFVNNFTHEFKTPIAVMKLAAGVLGSHSITEQPERLKRYSAIIADQTDHLQTQIEKILKTSASDQYELIPEKTSFSPNNIIKDVVHDMEPLIRQTGTRLEMNLETTDKEIQADESHISMVIVNLLENAIKYSSEPHVIISTSLESGHYAISVKDNGIGIEKKHLRHLFKKFFRVPTGNVHNVKGFGLGLNFVKKVVDAHKGKILVNSIPGIGTEFRITIPEG